MNYIDCKRVHGKTGTIETRGREAFLIVGGSTFYIGPDVNLDGIESVPRKYHGEIFLLEYVNGLYKCAIRTNKIVRRKHEVIVFKFGNRNDETTIH